MFDDLWFRAHKCRKSFRQSVVRPCFLNNRAEKNRNKPQRWGKYSYRGRHLVANISSRVSYGRFNLSLICNMCSNICCYKSTLVFEKYEVLDIMLHPIHLKRITKSINVKKKLYYLSQFKISNYSTHYLMTVHMQSICTNSYFIIRLLT